MYRKILTIVSFFALTLLFVSCSEFVPMNYTDTVLTGGQIEATFLKMGKEETAYYQVSTQEKGMGAYVVFYPKSLTTTFSKTFPVVIFANGTGVIASKILPCFSTLHHGDLLFWVMKILVLAMVMLLISLLLSC